MTCLPHLSSPHRFTVTPGLNGSAKYSVVRLHIRAPFKHNNEVLKRRDFSTWFHYIFVCVSTGKTPKNPVWYNPGNDQMFPESLLCQGPELVSFNMLCRKIPILYVSWWGMIYLSATKICHNSEPFVVLSRWAPWVIYLRRWSRVLVCDGA